MLDKEKVQRLDWITSMYISDYFSRLGGAGRYPGYEDWHSYAFASLLALGVKVDYDNDVIYEVLERNGLLSIYEIKELIGQVERAIGSEEFTAKEVYSFLFYTNELLLSRTVKQSPKKKIDRFDIEAMMNWAIFRDDMNRVVLPYIEAQQ